MEIITPLQVSRMSKSYTQLGRRIHINPHGQLVKIHIRETKYQEPTLTPEWMTNKLYTLETTLQEYGIEIIKTNIRAACYLDSNKQLYLSGKVIFKILVQDKWLLYCDYYQPNYPVTELLPVIEYTQPQEIFRWLKPTYKNLQYYQPYNYKVTGHQSLELACQHYKNNQHCSYSSTL